VSSCDIFDKTKADFPPNYIFMSFLYLTLDLISFIKVFLQFFFEYKKIYPVHKLAALLIVLCSTLLNFYLCISNFVWRAFIKESKPSME
jgi:hypothetical protein